MLGVTRILRRHYSCLWSDVSNKRNYRSMLKSKWNVESRRKLFNRLARELHGDATSLLLLEQARKTMENNNDGPTEVAWNDPDPKDSPIGVFNESSLQAAIAWLIALGHL
jgi:hypothetical protein